MAQEHLFQFLFSNGKIFEGLKQNQLTQTKISSRLPLEKYFRALNFRSQCDSQLFLSFQTTAETEN